MATLITILRSASPTDREETIIDRAVTILDERHRGVPILADLIGVIRDLAQPPGGDGLVDRVDALTRLNRQRGVGTIMITHTMSDLEALADPTDRLKARGFVERSGMVICGGLPAAEMPKLTQVVPLSQAEQEMLIGWQDPPAWDSVAGAESEPPGRGNFLIKVGGRSGGPGADSETVLIFVAIGAAAVVVGVLTAVVHIAASLDGSHAKLPGNPVKLALGLARGSVAWPASGTTVLIAFVSRSRSWPRSSPWSGRGCAAAARSSTVPRPGWARGGRSRR